MTIWYKPICLPACMGCPPVSLYVCQSAPLCVSILSCLYDCLSVCLSACAKMPQSMVVQGEYVCVCVCEGPKWNEMERWWGPPHFLLSAGTHSLGNYYTYIHIYIQYIHYTYTYVYCIHIYYILYRYTLTSNLGTNMPQSENINSQMQKSWARDNRDQLQSVNVYNVTVTRC